MSVLFRDVDGQGRDMIMSDVKLEPTEKSKNGYYVMINGVYVITDGPVTVDRNGPAKKMHPRVTLTLVCDELAQDGDQT
jgi:hypothetical protein